MTVLMVQWYLYNIDWFTNVYDIDGNNISLYLQITIVEFKFVKDTNLCGVHFNAIIFICQFVESDITADHER